MPVKDRKTKILLLLFLLKDTSFDYVNFSLEYLTMFDLTFNQKTKGSISSMIREGYIEKSTNEPSNEVDSNNEINLNEPRKTDSSQYRITQKGFELLCLEFPFFRYTKDDWDGVWRIISYEIPEKKREIRDRLRREMKGWGLGPWHRSFWVTAHPIIPTLRDLVYGKEEEQYVQAFEATHLFGSMEILVEKVWEKGNFEQKYKDLFKLWHEILSREITKNEKFQAVIYAYIQLLKDDPGLPSSLVGKKWIGYEAFTIFKEIRSILLS